MGASISWIGIRHGTPAGVMEALTLRPAEQGSHARGPSFQLVQIKTGWCILILKDINFPTPERLSRLSIGREIVACQIDEDLGYSAGFYYGNGLPIWALEHDGDRGLFDLNAMGHLPREFANVRDDALDEQAAEGGADAVVDYVFDIPMMLLELVTGYRHGEESLWCPPAVPITVTAIFDRPRIATPDRANAILSPWTPHRRWHLVLGLRSLYRYFA